MAVDHYKLPSTRPLRVFAFDPAFGLEVANETTIAVDFEKLVPGPVGRRLAVIDYDASSELFYEPVDLDHPAVLMRSGLAPSESDPRFHQQMVYAVASETIRRFELALGRDIRWRTQPGSRRDDLFHRRLRIFPHAFQQANAFYDPGLVAVLFGYFAASPETAGAALPNQTIFTCLSHDIIAHEMTHALVDGQREFLTDATGPDAAAFHEAFADIVALFQHFTYKDLLTQTIRRTRGLLYRRQLAGDVATVAGQEAAILSEQAVDNPLVGLARELGHATGRRKALREAIGTAPDPALLETVMEPHERGAILVSAVFDAYFSVYVSRTLDLLKLAGVNPAGMESGPELHPDLADRLAREAAKTASHFANICIRALDYCPAVDITFGDFLRAMITADSDLVPEDPHGYRAALIRAFRRRGILPEGVKSFSENALRWSSPDDLGLTLGPCTGLEHGILAGTEGEVAEARDARVRNNAIRLSRYGSNPDNAEALGLDPQLKVKAQSGHGIHRISPAGRIVVNFVAELLQQHEVPLDPAFAESPTFIHRGGATLIFDAVGNVRYVIRKSVQNAQRLERQRAFHADQANRRAAAPYAAPSALPLRINFQLVHGGA